MNSRKPKPTPRRYNDGRRDEPPVVPEPEPEDCASAKDVAHMDRMALRRRLIEAHG